MEEGVLAGRLGVESGLVAMLRGAEWPEYSLKFPQAFDARLFSLL